MVRTLDPIRSYLDRGGYDGYLIFADGDKPDQRYVSGFDAPDPYATLVMHDGIHLLVSALEFNRAVRSSRADTVHRLNEFDYQSLREELGAHQAMIETLDAFLRSHGVESVVVPRSFPTGTTDGLRKRDLTVAVEETPVVADIRTVKTDEEIERIRTTQQANEAALRRAEDMLEAATVSANGQLTLDGEVLTSERVKKAIEMSLLEHACGLDDTIVACGEDAADPHDRGSGPLYANQSIIIDIFPRHKVSRYFGDITRTYVKGEPTEELERRYRVTYEAYVAALETIEAGISARTVHEAVCDVFESAGYATLRSDPSTDTGFIHSTGHGVGLDIHEQPRISLSDETLAAGNVVTIEPGLYDPAVGGVRIEDLIVVTEGGFENLTTHPIGETPVIDSL